MSSIDMQRHSWLEATTLGLILSGLVASACGDTAATSGDDAATGGQGLGAQGGADTVGGRAQNGGASGTPIGSVGGEGGTQSGGTPSGGATTGGTLAGGAPTGGGTTTGGFPMGGATTGGTPTGGASGGGASGGGASGGGTPTAGGAGAPAGGAGGSDCPPSPPMDGSPCTPPWEPNASMFPELVTAHCSWGDDPRPGCRITSLCEGGIWQVTIPDCGDLLPPECSATPPESGSECADTAISCWYEDGTRCWCSECVGGSPYPSCQYADPPQWACRTPADGCHPLPQAGSPCTEEGKNCGLDCSTPLSCQDGRWQWVYCQSCCPICAAPNTPIATPDGEKPIASLTIGDLVYSVDNEAIRAVPLVRVAHTPVVHHRAMRIALENGQVLEISPGHPTADGRRFDSLVPGSLLDEQHRVVAAELVPYRYDATYDILPASSTGTYFAAGALVGSTLVAH